MYSTRFLYGSKELALPATLPIFPEVQFFWKSFVLQACDVQSGVEDIKISTCCFCAFGLAPSSTIFLHGFIVFPCFGWLLSRLGKSGKLCDMLASPSSDSSKLLEPSFLSYTDRIVNIFVSSTTTRKASCTDRSHGIPNNFVRTESGG